VTEYAPNQIDDLDEFEQARGYALRLSPTGASSVLYFSGEPLDASNIAYYHAHLPNTPEALEGLIEVIRRHQETLREGETIHECQRCGIRFGYIAHAPCRPKSGPDYDSPRSHPYE